MMPKIDAGASASASSGAGIQVGDVSHQSGGGGLLPRLSAKNAWIAYVAGAAVIAFGLWLWLKKR